MTAPASPAAKAEALRGRHAIVTGGGSGIGLAVAYALRARGASLTLVGRTAERLDAAREMLSSDGDGARVETVAADVTDAQAVERAVASARDRLGAIHILINNAGQAASAPFKRTDPALWHRMIAANLDSTYLCSRAVLADMIDKGWGRVVNVASIAGLTGQPYVTAYCAAKHGVIGLTRALAAELAAGNQQVTVNAVCPGYTETDMVTNAVAGIVAKTGRGAEEARAGLAATNPMRRLVRPEEVADTVAWLCAPESSGISGQAIVVG